MQKTGSLFKVAKLRVCNDAYVVKTMKRSDAQSILAESFPLYMVCNQGKFSCQSLMGKERIAGFTLIELIAVLSILAIIMAIGIPSFEQAIRNNRLTTYANDLVTAMNLARSEAIKRGRPVTVRKVDASSCTATGTNWEDGWDVFIDVNNNGVCNIGAGGDERIKTYGRLSTNYTLRGGNNGTGIDVRDYINFTANGEITPVGAATATGLGSFVICDNRDGNNLPEANTARLIRVNPLGQIRMGMDTNNDGIPNTNSTASAASNIAACTP